MQAIPLLSHNSCAAMTSFFLYPQDCSKIRIINLGGAIIIKSIRKRMDTFISPQFLRHHISTKLVIVTFRSRNFSHSLFHSFTYKFPISSARGIVTRTPFLQFSSFLSIREFALFCLSKKSTKQPHPAPS